MEKITKLRDLDKLVAKDYNILKEYSILPSKNNAIITEYINNGNDSITSVYHLYGIKWRLISESIKINTDMFRSPAFSNKFTINYDYKADNYLQRITGIASINKMLKMVAIKGNHYTLEDYDQSDVNYFYGSNPKIFEIMNSKLGTNVDVSFSEDFMVKRYNYNNTIAIVKHQEPKMHIKYTDIVNNRSAISINSFENNELCYIYKYGEVVVSKKITYNYVNSNNPLLNRRVDSINEIPIGALYDEYNEPLSFNHETTFLGEFNRNEGERARVYLYKANILQDRDLIFNSCGFDNIYYNDIVIICDNGDISIERKLLEKK